MIDYKKLSETKNISLQLDPPIQEANMKIKMPLFINFSSDRLLDEDLEFLPSWSIDKF